jgi:ribosomal protein L16 Arg81 hydroxylase
MRKKTISPFLEQLIAPITVDDFFENYWDKKHLHIRRDDADYFKDTLSLEQIEHFLQYSKYYLPYMELIGKGRTSASFFSKETMNRGHFEGKKVDKKKVQALFEEGHSILINHFSEQAFGFYTAIKDLKAFFEAKITDYLVISNAQLDAFSIHHDTEHVFAFQVSGEKEWSIYDYLARNIRTNDIESKLNPPASDVIVMKPGDCIYIPSCLRHSTRTVSDAPSISVSISIDQFYGTQLLQEVLKFGYVDNPDLNKMLPSPKASKEERTLYFENIKNTFIKCLEDTDFESIVEQLYLKEQKSPINPIRNENGEMDLESLVEKKEGVNAIAHKDGKVIRFRYRHHVLTFFQIYLFTFNFLEKQNTPFKVKDLFGMIDDEMKLKLVKKLVEIGYLRKA